MKIRKVYKLVAAFDGEMQSLCVMPKNGGVKYRLNRTTKPKIKNSKLYAYRNLESAKRAMSIFGSATWLIECEAACVLPRKKIPLRYKFGDLKSFWKHPTYKSFSGDLFTGVALCDSIKPIRIIEKR